MKECPICKAWCFDDMDVCYGCMHHFDAQGSGMSADPSSAAASTSEGATEVMEAVAPREPFAGAVPFVERPDEGRGCSAEGLCSVDSSADGVAHARHAAKVDLPKQPTMPDGFQVMDRIPLDVPVVSGTCTQSARFQVVVSLQPVP